VKIKIPPKIDSFQESVIREMTRIAEEENAINLSQGLPDFSAPVELKKSAQKAIEKDHNQYSFTYGLPELREKISKKIKQKNRITANPDTEITITCGVSEGFMSACLSLLDKGDEVIVFEPYYENYLPGIILSGAKPVFVSLEQPDFEINFDDLNNKINKKTKAIILNTPMNPSGKVFKMEEMKNIAELAEKRNLIIITDEIYEDIIYEGKNHISFASLEGMYDRTVSIMGFSKTYGITGWRVGYVLASKRLSNAVRKVHDYLTICAPTPFQKACIDALDMKKEYYENLRQTYRNKRDKICSSLQEIGFNLKPPDGTYYVMADFSELDNSRDDFEFAKYLTRDSGVASVPGTSFYKNKELGKKIIRFSYAVKEQTIEDALERIRKRLT